MKITTNLTNIPLDPEAYTIGDKPQGGNNTVWPFAKMEVDTSSRITLTNDAKHGGLTIPQQKSKMMATLRMIMKRYPNRQYRIKETGDPDSPTNLIGPSNKSERTYTIWRTV